MTRQSILFSALAVSLAVMSMSMAPRPLRQTSQQTASPMTPTHILTGVAFHAISGAF